MIIRSLSKTEFDQYVSLEPDANLYHSALYDSFSNSERLYLGVQDGDFYNAFAAISIVKSSWFKKDAVCEYGYLANFYDFEEIQTINSLIIEYLKNLKVSSFTISPNIHFSTKFGNNDLLIKQIQKLGYTKIEDSYIYSLKLKTNKVSADNSVFIVKKEDAEVIENCFNINLKLLRSVFKDNLHVFSSYLDLENSSFEKDVDKLKQINDELKGNNLLQCIVVVDYANNLYLINRYNRCSLLDSNDSLLNALSNFYSDKKEHSLIANKSFDLLEKVELIGKYQIDLKR